LIDAAAQEVVPPSGAMPTSINVTTIIERELVDLLMIPDDVYDVNSVLSMHGNSQKKNKKKLLFKVRWEGYSERHDTLEPWRNVKNNVFLHEFLTMNKRTHLIPKAFKIAK
jgi:hypothetical protein